MWRRSPSLMSSIDENEDGFRRSSTKYVTRENRQVIATHRSSRPLSENDNRLLAMLDEIYAGTVERQPGKTSILHETFKTTEELGVSTSSMGVRPILLSKHLIARNIADGRLVLILDEPEVHLHPAWQVAYARVLSAMSDCWRPYSHHNAFAILHEGHADQRQPSNSLLWYRRR